MILGLKKITLFIITLFFKRRRKELVIELNSFTNCLPQKKYFSLRIENYYQFISIDDEKCLLSRKFYLSQNYPNPFNPSTTISLQVPIGGQQTIKVFDVLGREVATLIDEYKNAGSYKVEFKADHLSSGVYFYQLQVGDYLETKKMILLK